VQSVALGGGRAMTEHGLIPIPGPTVVELLCMGEAPGLGGPVDPELATPTGVALLRVLADEFGSMPAMIPHAVGIGAGARNPANHANITRVLVGTTTASALNTPPCSRLTLTTSTPRLRPQVLTDPFASGALARRLANTHSHEERPSRAYDFGVGAVRTRVALGTRHIDLDEHDRRASLHSRSHSLAAGAGDH
jgi:uncharacterized protein (DUF111 family)